MHDATSRRILQNPSTLLRSHLTSVSGPHLSIPLSLFFALPYFFSLLRYCTNHTHPCEFSFNVQFSKFTKHIFDVACKPPPKLRQSIFPQIFWRNSRKPSRTQASLLLQFTPITQQPIIIHYSHLIPNSTQLLPSLYTTSSPYSAAVNYSIVNRSTKVKDSLHHFLLVLVHSALEV